MGVFDNIKDKLLSYFSQNENLNSEFIQYHHKVKDTKFLASCRNPCPDCVYNDLRIFANDGSQPPVGEKNHLHCHCYYSEVEQIPVGTISKMGELAPDVYLKKYGRLPDYYITKEEAMRLGWRQGKNTIAGKAPGKMIGGDIYKNKEKLLPEKAGRIWYECDVDYVGGGRGTCSRLYYSNDGLMFYTDHFKDKVYQIK